jgi:hypothetical protein
MTEDQIRDELEALEDEYRRVVTDELNVLADNLRAKERERDKEVEKLNAGYVRDGVAYQRAVREVQARIPDFQVRRNYLRQQLATITAPVAPGRS